jgi:hypothetical protein
MYRFNQMVSFDDKADFEAYWYGPEFIEWRTVHSSWYQVPILYTWNDLIHQGGLHSEPLSTGGSARGDIV